MTSQKSKKQLIQERRQPMPPIIMNKKDREPILTPEFYFTTSADGPDAAFSGALVVSPHPQAPPKHKIASRLAGQGGVIDKRQFGKFDRERDLFVPGTGKKFLLVTMDHPFFTNSPKYDWSRSGFSMAEIKKASAISQKFYDDPEMYVKFRSQAGEDGKSKFRLPWSESWAVGESKKVAMGLTGMGPKSGQWLVHGFKKGDLGLEFVKKTTGQNKVFYAHWLMADLKKLINKTLWFNAAFVVKIPGEKFGQGAAAFAWNVDTGRKGKVLSHSKKMAVIKFDASGRDFLYNEIIRDLTSDGRTIRDPIKQAIKKDLTKVIVSFRQLNRIKTDTGGLFDDAVGLEEARDPIQENNNLRSLHPVAKNLWWSEG